MLTLLTFGTLWFWFVIAIAFIIIVIATEKRSGLGATMTMIVTLCLLFMFGNKVPFSELLTYCANHGFIVLGYILGYIIIGILWSVLKWYSFLLKKKDEISEELEKNNGSRIYAPEVKYYKSAIMVWMCYWPFSVLWTTIDVPVKRMYQFIYRNIAKQLQSMSDKIFAPLIEKQKKIDEEIKEKLDKEAEERRKLRVNQIKDNPIC